MPWSAAERYGHKNMKKRLLSLLLALAMCLSLNVPAFAVDTKEYYKQTTPVVDSLGNTTFSESIETENELVVKVYVNNVLSQICKTNKKTLNATVTLYNGKRTTTQSISLSSHVSSTSNLDSYSQVQQGILGAGTRGALIVGSSGYDNVRSCSATYKQTYFTCTAYSRLTELPNARYDAHVLNFSVGTAVGAIISALLLNYNAAAVTVATLLDLGLPIVGGVLVDSITQTVCLTTLEIDTMAYTMSTLSAHIDNSYNRVMVSLTADGPYYSFDCYVTSPYNTWTQTVSNNAAAAYAEKYYFYTMPNLELPVDTLNWRS